MRLDKDGQPEEAARWDMGARIRAVAIAPGGAAWVIEMSTRTSLASGGSRLDFWYFAHHGALIAMLEAR